MDSSINGDYIFSNNTLINMSAPKSGLYLCGSFLSLLFFNNTFSNITSFHPGGVFLFLF
jgi:hypothetical protein